MIALACFWMIQSLAFLGDLFFLTPSSRPPRSLTIERILTHGNSLVNTSREDDNSSSTTCTLRAMSDSQGTPVSVSRQGDSSSFTTCTLRAMSDSQGSQGTLSPRPRLSRIAPKPSIPVRAEVHKPVKRASFKTPVLRAETSLTRTMNSCVRCWARRKRVSDNELTPSKIPILININSIVLSQPR